MNKTKTIFRINKNKDNPYVMMDKRPLENPILSYKAKGILAYLLSRPDGWEVNITDLTNHAPDGASAVRSGVNELREVGHVVYKRIRNDKKQIIKWLIEVHEYPITPQEKEKDFDDAVTLDNDEPQDDSISGDDNQNNTVEKTIVINEGNDLDSENRNIGNHQEQKNLFVKNSLMGNRTQLINDSINTDLINKLGAKNAPRAQVKKGDLVDGFLFYGNRGTLDVSDFPESVRGVVKEVCQLWDLQPPAKATAMSDFSMWIKGARALADACGEFGPSLLESIHADWLARAESSRFTVGWPGALVKTARAKAGVMRHADTGIQTITDEVGTQKLAESIKDFENNRNLFKQAKSL
jgi:hypothetical protein